MQQVVEKLIFLQKTISTMESCTGGYIASSITNIPGASKVFPFGAVTYATESKIKMGVPKEMMETFGVYSIETSKAMAKEITKLTGTAFGIGITGRLQKEDSKDAKVYISIYEKSEDKYESFTLEMKQTERAEEKQFIETKIEEKLLEMLEKY